MEVITKVVVNGGTAERKKSQEYEDELRTTKADIMQVKQENERLKTSLAHIIKDYQSLQLQFSGITHQAQNNTSNNNDNDDKNTTFSAENILQRKLQRKGGEQEIEEREEHTLQIPFSLGGSGSHHKEEGGVEEVVRRATEKVEDEKLEEEEELELGLNLGFEKKYNKKMELAKPESSVEELVKQEGEEDEEGEKKKGWVSRKILKNMRSEMGVDCDLSYNPLKKARVSVRARCDGTMMSDGCQWRKYGQKIAKGNPCPRSYYRCTVGQGCPVRKQVQRCSDDISILTTTYEGKHNHPLPPEATTMATTTSAAMKMLLSGSSNSRLGAEALLPVGMTNLNGFNFSLTGNSGGRPHFSISPSHPTITLDLTVQEPPSLQPNRLSRFPASFTSTTSRYYPSTFNRPSLESTTFPASRSVSSYLSYYGNQSYGNKSRFPSHNIEGQIEESFYKSTLQKINNAVPLANTQSSLTDTITAATKAITSDPSFQSALAKTVATVLGGHGTSQDKVEAINLGLNRETHSSSALPYSSAWKESLTAHRPTLAFFNHKNTSSPYGC